MRIKIKSILLPLLIPIIFLIVWNIIAVRLDNSIILPTVSRVTDILFQPGVSIIGMGSLIDNIIISLIRVLVGYVSAVIIGIPLGLFMGYSSSIFNLFNNFFGLFRPIPPLAWVPLVLAWFGVASLGHVLPIGSGDIYAFLRNIKISMVFIIFVGAFFPIITSTIYGVRNAKVILIESALTLGARKKDIFLKILIPAAAPSIVTGMRIGLGVAWMCLVSAEMLPGSISGVGYLIIHSYTIARTDIVIAGMISIGAVGAFLDYIFRSFEIRKFFWNTR